MTTRVSIRSSIRRVAPGSRGIWLSARGRREGRNTVGREWLGADARASALPERLQLRQQVAEQQAALEGEDRRGEAAGADGEGAGDGDHEVDVADGGQAAELVGEVLGRPVADDLQ